MPELPSHAPLFPSPHAQHPPHLAPESPSHRNDTPTSVPASTIDDNMMSAVESKASCPNRDELQTSGTATPALPASIVSPAFTPPSTPGHTTPPLASKVGILDRSSNAKAPKLLPRLPHVECIVRARIPTTSGTEMFLHLYKNDADNKEHLAIVFGNSIRSRSLDRVREGETEMDRMIRGAYIGRLRPGRVSSRHDNQGQPVGDDTVSGKGVESQDKPIRNIEPDTQQQATETQAPLVRIHSECYTGETAWSARCDCGEQLDEAARLMSETSSSSESSESVETAPGGVIIYLRQEGRGIGLGEKLKAYNLQDLGSDTVEANLLLRHPADARSYGLATAMLVDLGLGVDSTSSGIRLLTNNPDKIRAVEGHNREVIVKERVPMIPLAWRTGGAKGIRSTEVEGYLQTKIGKMGHLLG